MLRRSLVVALAASAGFLVLACGDSVAPLARTPQSLSLINGVKAGQCFLQLGDDGTQVPPDVNGNATLVAPAGEVVTRVAVKAGTPCYFTSEGATGSETISIEGAPCYVVEGLGTSVATVTRVGTGPACKDISHVELVSAVAPPMTGMLQVCVVLEGIDPPSAALTFAFPFEVAGQQLAIPQGTCAETIELTVGDVVISEQLNPFDIKMLGAVTTPSERLVGLDVPAQTATVAIAGGATTSVTITNLWVADPGGDHSVIDPGGDGFVFYPNARKKKTNPKTHAPLRSRTHR